MSLRAKIERHYDRLTPLYVTLWGEHLHHGYWEGEESQAEAQVNLIRRLAEAARIPREARVLDVGCGAGGSARWLAAEKACRVVGITLSRLQARIARSRIDREGPPALFLQADAAAMPVKAGAFDAVWIVECAEHVEDKRRLVDAAAEALGPGGRLALTGWFRGAEPPGRKTDADLAPILSGMLLPSLVTIEKMASWMKETGFEVLEASDVTDRVSRTWDVCIRLAQSAVGRMLVKRLDADSRRFVESFAAMKAAYASRSLCYGLLAAEKNSRGGRTS